MPQSVMLEKLNLYGSVKTYRRRQWQPTPVFLPGKSHGQRSLVGCSMGSRRVGHGWETSPSLFTFKHWRRKWQPTPVFLPGDFQGWWSLVGCHLWGRTGSDTAAAAAAWRPTRPSRTNIQKRCPFHYRVLEWKSRKTRRQEIPAVMGKFGLGVQNLAGQIELCQENALVIVNTLFQQHKRRLYIWT